MSLHVTALELPARWNRPALGLADAARWLGAGPRTDLAVLPETSLTGYLSPEQDFDLEPFAEPITGPTANALARLARDHRCFLVAPLVERDGAAVYNTTLIFAEDGKLVGRYRKRHPWYPETWATPGSEPPPVLEVRGARVTFAVCFDVHFVADDSSTELDDADVLVMPSAWVDSHDSLASLLPALARRFDVGIVNANWGVGSPRVLGQGRSRIVGRDGGVLATASGPGRIEAVLVERSRS